MKKRLAAMIATIILIAIGAAGYLFWKGLYRETTKPTPFRETKKERKILYYKCPMGLPDYSDKPGKAKCGMDYIPVYEDEAGTSVERGELYITPEKIQRIGVKAEEVKERSLKKVIRTVATVDYDEKRLYNINTKIEGWVEKLYVNATGRQVEKGEPLLEIYSPDLVSTQEEYLLAIRTRKMLGPEALPDAVEGAESIIDSAKRRLRNWDISNDQIEELEKSGSPTKTLTLHSLEKGVVIEKMVLQGMKVMPGEKLFTVADLSNVWLYADIYEYELSLVRVGQTATVSVNAYPGKTFKAKVSYIYPYLNPETRTAKVRLELSNPDFKLKPAMYANVELQSVISKRAIAVPEDAVIDTGKKQAVIIDMGAGRFNIQEIRVGLKGDGYYQVISGLSPGTRVVTSANFLIDSESSFRATAQTMLGMKHGKPESEGEEKPTVKAPATKIKPGEMDMRGTTLEKTEQQPKHIGH